VRLIHLEEGDRVVAVAKLAEPEENGEEPQPPLPVAGATPGSSSPGGKEGGAPFLDED
jgi:hypothetical protein